MMRFHDHDCTGLHVMSEGFSDTEEKNKRNLSSVQILIEFLDILITGDVDIDKY